MRRIPTLIFLMISASACGGGGDSTDSVKDPALISDSGVGVGDSIVTGDAAVRTLGGVQNGAITYYDADGQGNCSFDATPGDLDVAAMDGPEWANSEVCGECVRIDGPRGSLVVRIVDQCPACEKGHLDLSPSAFGKVADPVLGRVDVKWQVVSCAVKGPIAYRIKEGSSQDWIAIQVRNHRVPIRSLEAKTASGWVMLARQDYNYFVADKGLGPGPLTLRATDTLGQALTDDNIPVVETKVTSGAKQFD